MQIYPKAGDQPSRVKVLAGILTVTVA